MSRRTERILVAILFIAVVAWGYHSFQTQQDKFAVVQKQQTVLIAQNKVNAKAIAEETKQRSEHACLSSTSLRNLLGELQPNFSAEQQAEIQKFVSTNPNCASVSTKVKK